MSGSRFQKTLPLPSAPVWNREEAKRLGENAVYRSIPHADADIVNREVTKAAIEESKKETLSDIENHYQAFSTKLSALKNSAQALFEDYQYYLGTSSQKESPESLYQEAKIKLDTLHKQAIESVDPGVQEKMSHTSKKLTQFITTEQKIVRDGLQKSINDRIKLIEKYINELDKIEKKSSGRDEKLQTILKKTISTRKDLKELDDYRIELRELLAKKQAENKSDSQIFQEDQEAIKAAIEADKKAAEKLIKSADYRYYAPFLDSSASELEKAYLETSELFYLDLKIYNRTNENPLKQFIEKKQAWLKDKLQESINSRKEKARRYHATLESIEIAPVTPEQIESEIEAQCIKITCRADLKFLDDYNNGLQKRIADTHAEAQRIRGAAAQKGYGMILDANLGITPDMRLMAIKTGIEIISRPNFLGKERCDRYRGDLEYRIDRDRRLSLAVLTHRYVEEELPVRLKNDILHTIADNTFNLLQGYLTPHEIKDYYTHHNVHRSTHEGLEAYVEKLELFLETHRFVDLRRKKGRGYFNLNHTQSPLCQFYRINFASNSFDEIKSVFDSLKEEAATLDKFNRLIDLEIENIESHFTDWNNQLDVILQDIKQYNAENPVIAEIEGKRVEFKLDRSCIIHEAGRISAALLKAQYEKLVLEKLSPLLIKGKKAQLVELRKHPAANEKLSASFLVDLSYIPEQCADNDASRMHTTKLNDQINAIKSAIKEATIEAAMKDVRQRDEEFRAQFEAKNAEEAASQLQKDIADKEIEALGIINEWFMSQEEKSEETYTTFTKSLEAAVKSVTTINDLPVLDDHIKKLKADIANIQRKKWEAPIAFYTEHKKTRLTASLFFHTLDAKTGHTLMKGEDKNVFAGRGDPDVGNKRVFDGAFFADKLNFVDSDNNNTSSPVRQDPLDSFNNPQPPALKN